MLLFKKNIFLFIFSLLVWSSVCSQSESKFYSNLETKWLLEIPLWVPGFRGQLSYGDIYLNTATPKDKKELELIDKDPGLEFYFVGRASFRHQKLWIQADAFSGSVGNTFTFTPPRSELEKELVYLSATGTMPRIIFGYSVWTKSFNEHTRIEIIPYTGLRYIYIQFESEISQTSQQIDLVSKWFEPLIGVSIPFNYKRFRFEIQGDWGGNSAKNSTMINSCLKYRISRLIDTKLGWTSVYSHHKAAVQDEILDFDINLQGPTLGVGFNF